MISIILPVYNGEKFLRECITSIVEQDFEKFELIIIDDASSDNSTNIINSFEDLRIRLIKNESNLGLAKTLNVGIQKSKYNIIVRIDQDDIMYLNRLSRIVSQFEEDSSVGIVFSNANLINETSKKVGYFKVKNDLRQIRFNLVFINPFIHSTSAFNKLILGSDFSYDSSNIFSPPEDYELWSRLILQDNIKFKVIFEPLIEYRLLPDSFSRRNKLLTKNAINISARNIKLIYPFSQNDNLIYIITKRLYNEPEHLGSEILNLFTFLLKVNKMVNHSFYLSDLVFIFRLYALIVIPLKCKNLIKLFISKLTIILRLFSKSE